MKKLLAIAVLLCLLVVPLFADEANMSFTTKTFNVVSGGSNPYFYGLATNNTSIMFYMPGKGEQRTTLFWLNKVPLNTTVHVVYSDYVITDIKTHLVNGTWT